MLNEFDFLWSACPVVDFCNPSRSGGHLEVDALLPFQREPRNTRPQHFRTRWAMGVQRMFARAFLGFEAASQLVGLNKSNFVRSGALL